MMIAPQYIYLIIRYKNGQTQVSPYIFMSKNSKPCFSSLHPPSVCTAGISGTEQAFNRVRDSVRIPMYGCDCYAYGLLATGLADLVIEADLKPYDYMALVPIIKVSLLVL